MAAQGPHSACLTPYERAVCYYSLPKVISPLTFGVLIVYLLALALTLSIIGMGMALDRHAWLQGGLIVLVLLVLFSLIGFTGRAFLSNFRQRRYLAEAHRAMHAAEDSDDDNIPDPFERHRLFYCRCQQPDAVYEVCDDDFPLRYQVDAQPPERWDFQDMEDNTTYNVVARGAPQSFRLGSGLPALMEVRQGAKVLYRIVRRFDFKRPYTEILDAATDQVRYHKHQQGLYVGKSLIGRVYSLRGFTYLDIRADHVSPATLAYFISRNCY